MVLGHLPLRCLWQVTFGPPDSTWLSKMSSFISGPPTSQLLSKVCARERCGLIWNLDILLTEMACLIQRAAGGMQAWVDYCLEVIVNVSFNLFWAVWFEASKRFTLESGELINRRTKERTEITFLFTCSHCWTFWSLAANHISFRRQLSWNKPCKIFLIAMYDK